MKKVMLNRPGDFVGVLTILIAESLLVVSHFGPYLSVPKKTMKTQPNRIIVLQRISNY